MSEKPLESPPVLRFGLRRLFAVIGGLSLIGFCVATGNPFALSDYGLILWTLCLGVGMGVLDKQVFKWTLTVLSLLLLVMILSTVSSWVLTDEQPQCVRQGQ